MYSSTSQNQGAAAEELRLSSKQAEDKGLINGNLGFLEIDERQHRSANTILTSQHSAAGTYTAPSRLIGNHACLLSIDFATRVLIVDRLGLPPNPAPCHLSGFF
jgi:hypothetical protein